jgi:hypothetical protein
MKIKMQVSQEDAFLNCPINRTQQFSVFVKMKNESIPSGWKGGNSRLGPFQTDPNH